MVIQVWDRAGRLAYASGAGAPLPVAARPGYATLVSGGDSWRVYLAERGGDRVQVAQAVSVREELAAHLALRSLLPFLAMLPVLGMLIYLVAGRSLRPRGRLADALGWRSPRELQPLSEADQPPELNPVVAALDDLLQLLDGALRSQRAVVADAAHELRKPLTALKLQLQLAERAAGEDQRRDVFAKLHGRLDRAIHLVRQLLTAAREEGGAIRPAPAAVDLLQLAQACGGERYEQAEARRIDLGTLENTVETASAGAAAKTSSAPLQVPGNPDDLAILVGNLVDNALRSTAPGGRVDRAVARAGAQVMLQVADDGPGIAAADRERVFDRFYRGAGQAEWGSGLGLSIVRSIAEAHGATVALGDAPSGRGLLVTVRFRAAD